MNCSQFEGEVFDENDLATLYYLIVKKQEGQLTSDEKEELQHYLTFYLCWGREVLRSWLAGHGCLDYDSFVRHVLKWQGPAIITELCENKNEFYSLIDEPPEDIDAVLSFPVVYIEPLDVYISAYELFRDGLKPLYQRYRRAICDSDEARRIKKLLNDIENYIRHPTTLSDGILLADRLTHIQHIYGSILEDYGNLDVEYGRELAEKKLRGEEE